MARKIKVAFQGGGAKFIPLLAAAQAFRDAEAAEKIEVTAVSGTSAGSIVACLYSARVDLVNVRRHLRDNPRPYLALLNSIKSSFFFHRMGMAKKVWQGIPLISEKKAKTAYRQLFEAVGVGLPFPRLTIPTRVIAADLVSRATIIYDSTEVTSPDRLLQAVIWDSCGLPFIFKSHGMGNGCIVDGGICENLPADALVDIKDSLGALVEGEILGVSFEDTSLQIAPQNAPQFAMALLDTAIENSMRRAKRVLEDRVVLIKTDIGTFDFEEALSERSLGDTYELITRRTAERLVKILDTPPGSSLVIKKDTRAGLTVELQRRMSRIYDTQFAAETSYEVPSVSMVIIVNSLRPNTDRVGREDVVTQIVDLVPRDKPLQCYMMGLGTTGEFAAEGEVEGGATWRASDPSGADREVTVMPMIDEDFKTPRTSSVLVFFTPALEPILKDEGNYTVMQRDYLTGSMEKLRDPRERREQAALTWTRPVPAKRAEIVVFLPDTPEFQGITLKYFRFPDSGVIPVEGRRMSSGELNKYLNSPLAPKGMAAVGWVRDGGLKLGEQLAFELRMP